MVKEYLKNHGISNIEGVKKWAVVHIRFLSGADEDETSFDIENILSSRVLMTLTNVSQSSVKSRKICTCFHDHRHCSLCIGKHQGKT